MMILSEHRYSYKFYREQSTGSLKSARQIVPLILELVQLASVIDIGCGIGTWLSAFKEHGISDIIGVDGHYIERNMLLIPEERFIPFDLTNSIRMERSFDLVMSLEVAEHLPKEFADAFVESLTGLGSLVLFSAAIPFQRGTNHVNEQWPDYWTEKFEKRGYVVVDCLRRKIWQNQKVEAFYAQNLLMFVHEREMDRYPKLKTERERIGQLSIVHPSIYTANILTSDSIRLEIRRLLSALKHNALRVRE
jgi:cyclopropane fatty-acyl-phospholipid synthase-like methyltransferase